MAYSTSNPAMKDDVFARATADATQAGWASPTGPAPSAPPSAAPSAAPTTSAPPAAGVPPETVSPWTPAPPRERDYATMTLGGVVSAAAMLIVLVVAGGVFGWRSTTVTTDNVQIPGWILIPLLGGLGLAMVTIFKPTVARFTSPLYALCEGALLGAISRVYDVRFNGIVLQAVGLTIGVFLLMLFLYATRIIKVTDKLRMGIVAATGAVALLYVVDLIARLFGSDIGFIHSGGFVGVAFSVVVVGIAAFNLMLDFDIADRGVAMGAPKYMEWYAAFGLLVTLVWLYLEILRLLGKLRSN
jgi:uncharacterized YccA/Bax inhibitor family protein